VINAGKLILVDEKTALMARLGRTEARVGLAAPLGELPGALAALGVQLADDGCALVYRTDGEAGQGGGVADFVKALVAADIEFKSFAVHQSSLEDIFVDLVERKPA
jgi:ABC-2 type transport system ATP-binding protein